MRARAVALAVLVSKVAAAVWRGIVWAWTYRAPFVGSKISKAQIAVATARADSERRRRDRLSKEQQEQLRRRRLQPRKT